MKNVLFLVTLVSCMLATPGLAEMPDDYTMTFSIREDPADEQSDVIFQVSLDLKADSVAEGVIKWEVVEARFVQFDNGIACGAWTKQQPTVTSNDGLWHVAHDDPEDPDATEFNILPILQGTADADVSGDDLDYELATGAITKSEAAMYGGYVAGMTYSFQRETEPEPEDEGEDEPQEAEGIPTPPAG